MKVSPGAGLYDQLWQHLRRAHGVNPATVATATAAVTKPAEKATQPTTADASNKAALVKVPASGKGPIWEFFTPAGPDMAVCVKCKSRVMNKYTDFVLEKHLKTVHRELYSKFELMKKKFEGRANLICIHKMKGLVKTIWQSSIVRKTALLASCSQFGVGLSTTLKFYPSRENFSAQIKLMHPKILTKSPQALPLRSPP